MPQPQIDQIVNANPAAEILCADDNHAAIFDAVAGVDAVVGCPRNLMSASLLARAGNSLRWIHASGAGLEGFIFPELVNSGIILTNGKIIQGPEVADHALALLLALSRNLHYYIGGRAAAPKPRPIELRGKTAVVIGGGGGIGLLIAERVAACGMDAIAVNDDYVHMTSFVRAQYTADRLLEALPLGDAVLMAAPHTSRSDRMMNTAAFAAMKPGAFFVNVSRGGPVDTDALVAALRDGRLGGAGLDVTEPEPLPEDHALRHMENVILTPHVAGPSDHNRQRSFELILRNVQRFVAGQPLLNIVDKLREY